ncbi:MAG: hypothetical protein JXQ72_08060 [Anaerolineae bacterium]|nr:hypothetical protein [Anaerolineae bacterium]
MFQYSNDWEYKMVTAPNGEFASEQHLMAMLKRESLAGWTLAEKFSDTHVRLKRPLTAREFDMRLPRSLNPYQTYYDLTINDWVLNCIFYGMLTAIAVLMLIVLTVLASLPG